MARERVLALIMAGGAGGRMGPLTKVRAKPALPYGGVYRLIDFPLSNCMHSGISDVWIVEQYQPQSLNDHLAGGRPWDLDRTYGGLKVLPPYQGTDESGWHQGNVDAIYRNRQTIRDFAPDVLLVLSADHIYKLDYREVISHHLEHGAEATLVTTQVPIEQAGRFGVVEVDENGKVMGFEYKPEEPRNDLVTTEVFVYDAPKLLATLDELADDNDEEDSGLEDFGHSLIPQLVERGQVREYRLEGYWMDVGVPESYWQSHMDLLAAKPALHLDEPQWPILTHGGLRPAAHIHASARIENSLISPGCVVRGEVVSSVLSSGVVVEEGAVVRDSVILHDTRICAGARVGYSILDKDIEVGERAQVGVATGTEITLVGRWSRIPAGGTVSAGAQLPPNASEQDLGETTK